MDIDPKVRAFLKAMAQRGGQTRAKRLTATRRQEIARKAAEARWWNKIGATKRRKRRK